MCDPEETIRHCKKAKVPDAGTSASSAGHRPHPLPRSAPICAAAVAGPSQSADGTKPLVVEQKRRAVSNVIQKLTATKQRSRMSSQDRSLFAPKADPKVTSLSPIRSERISSKDPEQWTPDTSEQGHVVVETIVAVGDASVAKSSDSASSRGRGSRAESGGGTVGFQDVSTSPRASTRQLSTTPTSKSNGDDRKTSKTPSSKGSRGSKTAKRYSKRSTGTSKADNGASSLSSRRSSGIPPKCEAPKDETRSSLPEATDSAAAEAAEMSCAVALSEEGGNYGRNSSSSRIDQGDPELKFRGTKSVSVSNAPPTELSLLSKDEASLDRRIDEFIPDQSFSTPGMATEDKYRRYLGDAVTTFFAAPITEDFRREMEDIGIRVGKNAPSAGPHRGRVKATGVTFPSTVRISASAHENDEDDHSGNVVLMKRELCLYPLCILLSLAIMGVTLIFVLPTHPATGRHVLEFILNRTSLRPRGTAQPTENLFCQTEACRQDAVFLDNLLSWNVDPCDNFYQFICHRWTNHSTREGSKSSVDSDYAEQLENRMYTVIQNLTKGNVLLQPLRSLFRECISIKDLESAGWDPLLELLALTDLEGFPFTPPVRSSASVWKTAAKVLKVTGAAVLLNVDVVPHPRSGDRDVVALGLPDTMADVFDGNMNDVIQSYYSVVYTAVRALKKEFIPPLHTIQIVDFAYELERLFVETRSKSAPSIQSLSNYPELRAFVSETFEGVTPPAYLGASSDVLLSAPEFIANLLELVKRSEPHIVMNLLGVRMMVQVSAFTPLTDLTEVFASLLYRKPRTSVHRWQICVRLVERTVPPLFLLAALLDVRIQSVTSDLSKIVGAIVEEVLTSLDGAEFLDDAGKSAARKVVSKTAYRVLGPDWVGDKSVVEQYLSTLPKVVRGQGLMSYAVLHKHSFSSRLARGTSGSRWTPSLFQTDCWSQRQPRAVYVPVLFLNVSLRATAEESKALQLPRAGFRFARCVFRSLFREAESWMNEYSRTKLETTLRCLRNQYGSDPAFPMPQLEDNLAVRPALRHFVEAMHSLGNGTSLRLPRNGDLGPEQLFFTYLMLQSCTAVPAKNSSEDSSFPQNVPFQNEPAFQTFFRCSGVSYMSPHQKCRLWTS